MVCHRNGALDIGFYLPINGDLAWMHDGESIEMIRTKSANLQLIATVMQCNRTRDERFQHDHTKQLACTFCYLFLHLLLRLRYTNSNDRSVENCRLSRRRCDACNGFAASCLRSRCIRSLRYTVACVCFVYLLPFARFRCSTDCHCSLWLAHFAM